MFPQFDASARLCATMVFTLFVDIGRFFVTVSREIRIVIVNENDQDHDYVYDDHEKIPTMSTYLRSRLKKVSLI